MSTASLIAELRSHAPVVAPSLLACDFAHLEAEIRRVEEAGARILHLDVMDGHFVPNISIGVPIVEAVRRVTDLPLDVHLMISDPARYAQRFRDAGADLISFHIEAVPEPGALLEEIRRSGAAAGLAINPPTDLGCLAGSLDLCDYVLIMSVMPGFGGQAFQPEVLEKVRRLRAETPELLLSIDGGLNRETVGRCAKAGIDMFVIGSALFSQPDYARFIREITALATSFGG